MLFTLIPASFYKLIKKDTFCGPDSTDIEEMFGAGAIFQTATDCALKCKEKKNCRFFSYGKWSSVGGAEGPGGRGRCFWAKTLSGDCPKGFKENMSYDFYAMPGNIYRI